MSSNADDLITMLLDSAMESNKAFSIKLKLVMKQMGLSSKELSESSRVPLSTINKILYQERDLRLSTLRDILNYIKTATTPSADIVIGIIATRTALDTITQHQISVKGKKIFLKEYPSSSIEDVIVNAIRAERDRVNGLICATIVANLIEKFVRIPIMSVKLGEANFLESVSILVDKIPLE
jgi:predicted transcriptional regulator